MYTLCFISKEIARVLYKKGVTKRGAEWKRKKKNRKYQDEE
jgi:hypothetical protein